MKCERKNSHFRHKLKFNPGKIKACNQLLERFCTIEYGFATYPPGKIIFGIEYLAKNRTPPKKHVLIEYG